MPHPHAHNLTALVAVAEFAREHELPITTIHMPGSAFSGPDAITVEVPWGEDVFHRWLDAMQVDVAVVKTRRRKSIALPGTEIDYATARGPIPTLGVMVSVDGRWRVE